MSRTRKIFLFIIPVMIYVLSPLCLDYQELGFKIRGSIKVTPVSAEYKRGVDDALEMILLVDLDCVLKGESVSWGEKAVEAREWLLECAEASKSVERQVKYENNIDL